MADFMKKAIKSTFLSLIDQKPLSQITVKMIVEECGINRNSFYYHYHDLPELIEEIVKEDADRIISEYPSVESINIALTAAVDFASKNRRAIQHIYYSVNRDILEKYLWQVCDYSVDQYVGSVIKDIPISEEDKELISQIYKYQTYGLVIHWLNDQMNSDVNRYIDRFCELQKGMFEEMIRRCTS